MEEAQVYDMLLGIEKIVKSPEFTKWQESFIDEHVDKFDFEEENKLEYTEIFNQYEAGVEKFVVDGLPGGDTRLRSLLTRPYCLAGAQNFRMHCHEQARSASDFLLWHGSERCVSYVLSPARKSSREYSRVLLCILLVADCLPSWKPFQRISTVKPARRRKHLGQLRCLRKWPSLKNSRK